MDIKELKRILRGAIAYAGKTSSDIASVCTISRQAVDNWKNEEETAFPNPVQLWAIYKLTGDRRLIAWMELDEIERAKMEQRIADIEEERNWYRTSIAQALESCAKHQQEISASARSPTSSLSK